MKVAVFLNCQRSTSAFRVSRGGCHATISGRSVASSRDGFTILELILSIGLTTLLMAALYSAMSIYWTTALESYDEIERAQIARAILRDMARDIRSCTFVEQQTMSSEESDDEDETEDVDPDTAIASYTNGLFGTDKDLVLYVSRPDKDSSNYISAQELIAPGDRSSDEMIIRYVLVEEGGGGLAGEFANDPEFFEMEDPVKGLARMQGDLMGLSNAISVGDVDMQLAATDMLATEVSNLRFQYFDGVEYQPEWDSTTQNAMPLAIEIVIELRTLPNPNDERQLEEQPGYMPPSEHRLVVPVPVAAPYVGEEL